MSEIVQVGDQGLKASETQIDTMASIIRDFKLEVTAFRNIINGKDEIIETYQEENATLVSDKELLAKKNNILESENKAMAKALRRKSIALWSGISGTVLITVPLIVLLTTSN